MTLTQLDNSCIWRPFTQEKNTSKQIVIERGKGAYLYDTKGKKYLDLVSSWWTNLHGHAHPKIAEAIYKQALQVEHTLFASFSHKPAIKLSKRLIDLLKQKEFSDSEQLQRVFFSDNGSTSVEIALKMVYQFWQNKGQKRNKFIAFNNGYHGDTFGAMSVGKSSGFYKKFEDLLFDVDFMPFPSTWLRDDEPEIEENEALSEIKNYIAKYRNEIAGLIIEPLIQGAGGFNISRENFLRSLVNLCRENNILVIFDEVVTGFGRTGDLFACKKAKVIPDIICLSKGITGGFIPFAATVVQEKIYEAFLGDSFNKAFAHGHSYAANPIGCAASLMSLELLTQERTLDKIRIIEEVHKARLEYLSNIYDMVKKVRFIGTIAAFNLEKDSADYEGELSEHLKCKFLERGVAVRPIGNIIYLIPPYCIEKDDLYRAYQVIESVISTL